MVVEDSCDGLVVVVRLRLQVRWEIKGVDELDVVEDEKVLPPCLVIGARDDKPEGENST
jgi:hypothetical protein